MDYSLLWKAVIVVVGGTLLLRIAGRKSISQMTLAQTVIMIGIGSLLIQPIVGHNLWFTLLIGGILVLTLFVMETIQVKSDKMEQLITGKSKIIVENGSPNEQNLKKPRMTIDQLEMNLRQQNVTKISDVKYATLEPNGQVGFTLKEDAQPVTKKEWKELKQEIQQLKELFLTSVDNEQLQKDNELNRMPLFEEVNQQPHLNKPPKRLQ